MEMRLLAAAPFHQVRAYSWACSYQVTSLRLRSIDSGKPVASSKASKLRAATMSWALKASAKFLGQKRLGERAGRFPDYPPELVRLGSAPLADFPELDLIAHAAPLSSHSVTHLRLIRIGPLPARRSTCVAFPSLRHRSNDRREILNSVQNSLTVSHSLGEPFPAEAVNRQVSE